jgi:hypothetical protein
VLASFAMSVLTASTERLTLTVALTILKNGSGWVPHVSSAGREVYGQPCPTLEEGQKAALRVAKEYFNEEIDLSILAWAARRSKMSEPVR